MDRLQTMLPEQYSQVWIDKDTESNTNTNGNIIEVFFYQQSLDKVFFSQVLKETETCSILQRDKFLSAYQYIGNK
ncbi:MAG: hypothetical protein DRQ88_05975 [Epsilonproteobacteria bacterium]|nr:MAG: hypothetical protein DRQ88_05975 [Campylobacterota bacterium]